LVSGAKPTDWKLRSGATPPAIDRFQILNHDAARVIDAVGAGVSPEHLGQRVAHRPGRAARAVTRAGR
jgi:NADPH:quinone reductase-like Zn-dependent oxidoreductase